MCVANIGNYSFCVTGQVIDLHDETVDIFRVYCFRLPSGCQKKIHIAHSYIFYPEYDNIIYNISFRYRYPKRWPD